MALTDLELDLLAQSLVPTAQKMEGAILSALGNALKAMGQFFQNSSPTKTALKADREYQKALAEVNGGYRKAVSIAQKTAKQEIRSLVPDVITQATSQAFAGDKRIWAERGGIALTGSKPSLKLIDGAVKELTQLALPTTSNLGFVLKTGALEPARSAFVREIDKAVSRAASGEITYDQACKEAIRTLSKSGVRTIDYASGKRLNVDSAVRLNVQTVCAQLSGKMTMENIHKTGVNHVEVSAHTGAREGEGHADHIGWQGKVYQINGSSPEYSNLEEATGYPSDPTGLYGYNCRHQMYPFWPGISEPANWKVDTMPREYNGKSYTPTQAAARQRALEREIRALKREAYGYDATGEKRDFRITAEKIKAKTGKYTAFSQAMDLRPKADRLWVYGYDRGLAQKSNWAIKKGREFMN